jgi:hypothetical protein
MNLLDIITITKNDLEGVRNTLESTSSIIGSDIQQIVIDSSDNIIKSRVKELSKLKDVEYNWYSPKGIANAFNKGLATSNSEWIWFMNGGDVFNINIDIDCIKKILENTTADVVIFDIIYNGDQLKHPPLHSLWPPVFNWISHPSVIMRRKLLSQLKGFDDSYNIAMDYELWFRILKKETLVDLCSIPLIIYEGGGLSENFKVTAIESRRVVKKNINYILRYSFLNIYRIFRSWVYYFKLSLK